jgi:hypothetical protein
MNRLPIILILSALSGASTVPRDPDAVPVFQCDFSEDRDINYDGWPDHWTREEGREYPAYLRIAVSQEPSPVGDRCLRMELDGGAAAVRTPLIPVHPQFSYVLEGYLKTEGLEHDVAYYSVQFLDDQQNVLLEHTTTPVGDAATWRHLRLGPLIPPGGQARQARVGLHLRPRADQADLRGAALFDDLWFARVPQMALRTNSPHNVYQQPDQMEITCQVSGVVQRDPLIRFVMRNESDQPVDQWETRVPGRLQSTRSPGPSGSERSRQDSDRLLRIQSESLAQEAYVGSVTWKPTVRQKGFYRVQATMRGPQGSEYRQTISLAVIDAKAPRSEGEFGWSLPQGEHPLAIRPLVGLLTQVGINWVKFPVWFSDGDAERADRLAWFAERLSSDGIELVGVLDQPPAEARKRFGEGQRLPAAAVFQDPDVWHPVLDPVMTRLSLKVQWWQLGRDDDHSYVAYTNLPQKIDEVKSHLRRFGQSIRLGINWRWLYDVPVGGDVPWDFLSLSETPPLTEVELSEHLAGDHYGPTERWVVLRPLARSHYDVRTRAHDLVGRMLAAKTGGARRVFIPEPFSREHGLMNEDGTPGELLLPWRTTALMIAGAEGLGSLTLPQGSPNQILVRGEEAIMVVWNGTPTHEPIYLGEEVRQVDLWGRETVPPVEQDRQAIAVGLLPTFVTGVSRPVAEWRLSFNFDHPQISSVVGRPQTVSYRVRNPFPQGISGQITFDTPEVWGPPPPPVRFKLAEKEEFFNSFLVTLRPDASSGRQNVRVDFDVAADQRYRFSVYRTMDVGLGDVSIALNAHINRSGELIVEQRLTNQSDQFVSFNCYLYAPRRQRLRHQVFDLARGTNKHTFLLPGGAELVGSTIWLRAEEIGGERVLNHRLKVEK